MHLLFLGVSDISQEMAINSYDIVSTLQALGMMKYWKGKHIILKKQVTGNLSTILLILYYSSIGATRKKKNLLQFFFTSSRIVKIVA